MPPQEPEGLIPAIGYIRVSTAREEMISPEIQEAAIRDWARRNRRRIVRIIPDLDVSGRTFKRKVRQAIEAVQTGEAREIIVWKFSRFGRNRLGWAVHLDMVESFGGQLQSATEEIDARTAAGRFTRGMLAEVAAFQSDVFGEQWKETHSYRIAAGLPATGGPRFGYVRRGRTPIPGERSHYKTDPNDPKGERYEPDPALRDVYVGLYERYVHERMGANKLVQWINELGVRTVRGDQWSTKTLYHVLDSGFAAGLLRIHNPDCRCKQRGRCRDALYLPGAQPAIISGELWEAYLARRKSQRQYGPRSRIARYPLSGLMKCGSCTRSMSALSEKDGRGPGYAFRCDRKWHGADCSTGAYVTREYAEEQVLAKLAEWAAEIEQAAAETTPAGPIEVIPARPDTDRIRAELAKVERALVRLKKLRALDDDDTPESEREYLQARDELRAERDALAAQLAAAQEVAEQRPEMHAPVILGLLVEWDTLIADERRDMLASVIREIKVHSTGGRNTPPRLDITPVWAPIK